VAETDFRQAQAARYEAGAADAFREVLGKWRTYRRKASIVATALRAALRAPGDVALEVGCGSGLLTRLVAEAVPERRIVGSDFSAAMLESAHAVCRACPNVEFRVHDIYQRFDGGDFAFAYGCDIIHHLDDPVLAFTNLWHALRPGGRVLFLESNPRNPVMWLRLRGRDEEKRVFLNSERTLAEWARAAGFVDIAVDLLPFHLPNGPRPLGRVLDAIEDGMHRIGPVHHRAALFGVTATKPT
jgi:SAM-dependent methyltransferase